MTPSVVAVNLVLAMLTVALALAIGRVVYGPSTPDRIVALNLVSTLVIGIIAVYAITTAQTVFLDAAILLALIAFLGTVAFAQYVRERERKYE